MAFADAQANAVILHGETEGRILLAGTVTRGDAVGYSSGWKRALATVGTAIQMRCTAAEDGVSGQYITAYFGDCVVGGTRFSGGTAGSALYVAEGTNNGEFTETQPSTTGDCDTIVGYVINTTTVFLTPHANTHSVAS
jgi:hypothetical protein